MKWMNEGLTSPMVYLSCLARMMSSIWKTYPLDTHRSTRLSNTSFLYSLTRVRRSSRTVRRKRRPHTQSRLIPETLEPLTWSYPSGLKHPASATFESGSWPPDWGRQKETGWGGSNNSFLLKGSASGNWRLLLTVSHLMSFLRRSQPYTPPFPL